MCSSTPRVFTPLSRAGFLIRRLASAPIASQAVCQSTPKCRASAETVVSSCRNASTAHAIARVVSLDRNRRSHGSRSTSRPGRPARRNARSACATAPAPADRSTGSRAAERHGGHGRPRRPHTNRSPRAPRRSRHPAPQCRPHGSPRRRRGRPRHRTSHRPGRTTTRQDHTYSWVRLPWRDVAGSQIRRAVEELRCARAGSICELPTDRLGFPAEAGLCPGSARFPGGC